MYIYKKKKRKEKTLIIIIIKTFYKINKPERKKKENLAQGLFGFFKVKK